MGIQVEVCIQQTISPQHEELQSTSHQPNDELPADLRSGSISPEQWEHWFQQWLEQIKPDLSPIQAYELSLRLTDDREIQHLNADYRQQDTPTDVLAFAALETECPATDAIESQPLYLGDIVISVETAQRQAIEHGHPVSTELAWLASHGLLHLLGWDHPDLDSLEQMLTLQKALLNTVGVSIRGS